MELLSNVARTPIFLGLGSNVEREFNLRTTLEALASRLVDMRCSSVYECESVGYPGPHYFNMVVSARTDMSLGALNTWLKELELMRGRRAGMRCATITIDIDLLLYGDLVGCFEGMLLPRQAILKHAFVLLPLSTLAPDHLHPQTKTSFAELWQAMKETEKMRRVDLQWQVMMDFTGVVVDSRGC